MSTPRSLPILVGVVFADQPSALEVIGTVTALVAAIGLGVFVFAWMRNWRKRLAEESDPEEPVETYQQMLNEGLIDAAEFERIAGRLREKPQDTAPSGADTGIRNGPPPGDIAAGPPPAGPPTG